jgi:hypothetical protein
MKMKEITFVYTSDLPWNGSFLVREGLSEWSKIEIHGFYTVSYYDTYGKKIWDIIGILPQDIDTLIDTYALKPKNGKSQKKPA